MSHKICQKIRTNLFSESRAMYEIMWKTTVQRNRPQMTI